MAVEILGTQGAGGLRAATDRVAKAAGGAGGQEFSASLDKLLDGVEQTAGEANDAIAGMLDKSTEVHDAMIALQRAEMTLQLTVQIRNKLVQAYQEVMRMPV